MLKECEWCHVQFDSKLGTARFCGNKHYLKWWIRQPKRKEWEKEYGRQLRKDAIEAYGNKCQCCGEAHFEFLCIDHIKGGGNKHRRELGLTAGYAFYSWLKTQGYPKDDFRCLCNNCNTSKGHYGYCPHEKE